jgi:conjugal transfer pilus assembly protein TraV
MKSLRSSHPFIVILLSLLLAGCGPALNPYHEEFNCRAVASDGRCVDTPTAYQEATSITELAASDRRDIAPPSTEKDYEAIRLQRLTELLREPKAPILEPPRVLRVLILPYKGDREELFMARYAYIKMDEAEWILTGVADKEGE